MEFSTWQTSRYKCLSIQISHSIGSYEIDLQLIKCLYSIRCLSHQSNRQLRDISIDGIELDLH